MKNTGYSMLAVLLGSFITVQGAVLTNPGFETGDFTGWSPFGSGWRIGAGADANSGSSGAVNDVFTTDGDNFRGISQIVSVEAGMSYLAGAYIRGVNVETSQAWFELQWLDSGLGIISQLESTKVTADQPYTFMSLGNVTAPIGAESASVRGIVQMVSQPPVDTDFLTFDDFEFAAVPEPMTAQLMALGGAALFWLRRTRKGHVKQHQVKGLQS